MDEITITTGIEDDGWHAFLINERTKQIFKDPQAFKTTTAARQRGEELKGVHHFFTGIAEHNLPSPTAEGQG